VNCDGSLSSMVLAAFNSSIASLGCYVPGRPLPGIVGKPIPLHQRVQREGLVEFARTPASRTGIAILHSFPDAPAKRGPTAFEAITSSSDCPFDPGQGDPRLEPTTLRLTAELLVSASC